MPQPEVKTEFEQALEKGLIEIGRPLGERRYIDTIAVIGEAQAAVSPPRIEDPKDVLDRLVNLAFEGDEHGEAEMLAPSPEDPGVLYDRETYIGSISVLYQMWSCANIHQCRDPSIITGKRYNSEMVTIKLYNGESAAITYDPNYLAKVDEDFTKQKPKEIAQGLFSEINGKKITPTGLVEKIIGFLQEYRRSRKK